jgi:DNA-binding transcriptional regulator YiaG
MLPRCSIGQADFYSASEYFEGDCMTATMITGDQIKAIRKERGWSQTEFGRRVGANQNTVSIWESGRRAFDRTTELAIFAVVAGFDEKPPRLPPA